MLRCLMGCMFVAVFLSSCAIVAPFVQTYSEIGVTDGDRQALLDGSVKDFNSAMYWGDMTRAVSMAADEGRPIIKKEIRRRKKEERVVDTEVELVDFDEDSYNAEVEVLVKYYKVPYYIVNERIEMQRWTFETGSGWRFVSVENVDAG